MGMPRGRAAVNKVLCANSNWGLDAWGWQFRYQEEGQAGVRLFLRRGASL